MKVADEKSKEAADGGATTTPMVSYVGLFRFADSLDIFLMILGIIGAMGFGVVQPLLSVLLGDVLDSFNQYGSLMMAIQQGTAPADSAVIEAAKQKVADDVVYNVYLFIGIGAAAFVASWLQQSTWIVSGERQARRVRRLFLEAVLRQDVSFFDENLVGDLTTRLSSDTTLYQEGISERVTTAVVCISTFIAALIIALVKSWNLTLVCLTVTPIIAVAGAVVGKAMAAGTELSQEAYGKAGAVAQESLANIRTIFAFNGQKRAHEKFDVLLVNAMKINEAKFWKTAAGFATFFSMLFGMYAIAFGYGGILVEKGEIAGGDVLTVIFAVIIGAFGTINLAPALQSVNKARGVATKLFSVIDKQPQIPSHLASGKKLDRVNGKIEFRDVTFAYPKRPDVVVLKKFNMTIQPGEKVALVGFSGSGKSTIIQLLERFYDPIEGEILLDDVPIKEFNVEWLRQSMGLVSQEPILFDASIEENIRFGILDNSKVTQSDIESACRMANAHDFIAKLPKGYQTQTGERGSLLSGGQKQRIALARALIKNPRILLLDEATSALDTESERIVQKAIDKVSQDRTTITIAHRLSTIKDADNIIVMDKGVVIENGKHSDLLSKDGHYANLVRSQEMKKKGDQVATDSELTPVEAQLSVGTGSVDKKAEQKNEKEDELTDEEKQKRELERIFKENKIPLLRVLRLQKPEYLFILTGLLVSVLNGAILPLFGVFFGEALAVFRKPPAELLEGTRMWAFIFLGLMVGNYIVNFLQIGCFGAAGERLTRRIRASYFMAMLRQEAAFFDDPLNGTGALTARLSDDAEKIQGLTGPTFGNLLQLVTSLTVAIALAFYYSWKMTLVVLGTFPLIAAGGIIESKMTFGALANPKVRKAYAEASQSSCDAIANIRTVKSLTVEKRFLDLYMKKIEIPYRLGLKRGGIGSAAFGFSQALQFWIYAIAFYAGYRFVFDGSIGPTDMFTVLFSILFGAIALSQAATFGPNLTKASVAAINYFSLIDKVPTIDSSLETGEKPVDVQGQASVDNVHFKYPQRPDVQILKGVSAQVKPGKTVALVGPSGSGKSTIVAMIERFYDPDQGSVSVENTDVKKWNLRYLREKISIVAQEPSLFIGTIAENISYGFPEATQSQIEDAAKMANIHDFIISLPDQYKTEISNSQLSGGQKQRIAIARALILKPKILLLDEATSALDSESEKVVQLALNKASEGRTTITIAHRLSTIQNADLIVVMKDGQVVEEGQHFDLLEKRGVYAALVAKQQLN